MSRILLINDLVDCGGTERQHWMEFQALERAGYDVYSLTFDPEEPLSTEGHRQNYPVSQGNVDKALSRMFILPKYRFIRDAVDRINPDFIHLNNTFKTPVAVFDAIRSYKNVQTARDYGVICPKSTCVHSDYSACKGYTHGDCLRCGLDKNQLIKYFTLRNINRVRSRSCDKIVAPSHALAAACVQNGLDCACINDMFDFGQVPEMDVPRTDSTKRKRFLYLGAVGERKGIKPLIQAFSVLPNDGTWQLAIAGNLERTFSKVFHELMDGVADLPISYLGGLRHDEALAEIRNSYCVVVPSLWIENYPNSVLEAIACSTLVIGSNRGGIPELIGDESLLFDPLDVYDMVLCIKHVIGMSDSEYRDIVRRKLQEAQSNNSLDRYIERLVHVAGLPVNNTDGEE